MTAMPITWAKRIPAPLRSFVKVGFARYGHWRDTIHNRVAFPIWRSWSHFRYGERRLLEANGYDLWVRTDDLRSYWIWRDKGTQPSVLATWEAILELRPDVAIDVGANYGEFSMPAAARRIPLLAIEANPWIHAELKRTLAPYDDVTVLNAAASDAPGEVELHIPAAWSGAASLSAAVAASVDSRHLGAYHVESVRIPALMIDAVAPRATSVALKIDVEGYDCEVFKGAMQTIAHSKWWRALVEFSAATLEQRGLDPQAVWAVFAAYNGAIIINDVVTQLKALPEHHPRRANLLIGGGQAE